MSLSLRIIGTIMLALTLLLSAFAWYLIQDEQRLMDSQLNKKGEAIVHAVSVFSIETLLTEDYPVLETVLKTIGEQTGEVILMEVIHGDKTVARYHRTGRDQGREFFSDVVFRGNVHNRSHILGKVRLLLSDADYRQLLETRRWESITSIAIIFVVISLAIAFILRRIVLGRIEKLSLHVALMAEERIETDHVEYMVGTEVDDEIDLLFSRYGAMLDAIQDRELERDRVMAELVTTRGLLENVINSMPSILVAVDIDGSVIRWNHEAERATGRRCIDVVGKPLQQVCPELAPLMERVKMAIRRRSVEKKSRVEELVDGDTRYKDMTIYPLVTNGVDGAVIRIDDVTERVRMEELMAESEKMMSLGGLAAGLSHEVKNTLVAMTLNIQAFDLRLSAQSKENRDLAEACGTSLDAVKEYMDRRDMRKLLNETIRAGNHTMEIVENMLSFSRRSELRYSLLPLDMLMERTLSLAANDLDLMERYAFDEVEIVREYEVDMPMVECGASRMQQVFFNLVKNAVQAMADNASEEKRMIIRIKREGEQARIEIEDNGHGMEEKVRERIFEPFYSNKPHGDGTGLGLWVSYYIVAENHRGTLQVESAPDEGARFVVLLPIKRL